MLKESQFNKWEPVTFQAWTKEGSSKIQSLLGRPYTRDEERPDAWALLSRLLILERFCEFSERRVITAAGDSQQSGKTEDIVWDDRTDSA